MIEEDEKLHNKQIPVSSSSAQTSPQEETASSYKKPKLAKFKIEPFEDYLRETISATGRMPTSNPEAFPELFKAKLDLNKIDDVQSEKKLFKQMTNAIKLYTNLLNANGQQTLKALRKKRKHEAIKERNQKTKKIRHS